MTGVAEESRVEGVEEPRVEIAPVRPGEELDWDALEAYLRSNLDGLDGEFSVLQFPRGSANLTYRVAFGDRLLVVRRPPFGQIARGAHDMAREHRVLARLYRAYDRAPRALLHCADTSVVGAEFFVSEYRDGIVVWDEIPESMSHRADAGRRIGFAVVDGLADLHAVDPASCDLADLGRPEGYLERQVSGWSARWDAVAEYVSDREVADLVEEVGLRIRADVPASQRAGIVHNDYKVDNCQFPHGDPDRVKSVFDWDMATTGDVLVDLGALLNYWPDRTVAPDSDAAFIVVPGMHALDLPSRAEIVERYASGSDLDLSRIDWYEAFGCWKTVVILQQLYARFVRGETTDPRMGQRGELVAPLARRALGLLPA
ncbi:phosphotransferase family protein [Rhodococcus rhodochrous]|uniref:phosphotransferase family protein n=1 Tax=Rhodococcus rhodochrous TaxID=1829 RepID=UPI001E4F3D4E|nr:phosphotransferase family protein [Rhodococcus rhodochrous]MCD2095874.1 phosphotransferase family protein [Rhodococcus rhodochrous]MCD2119692.1 phosphotransferase family protein [Rhodococcus rhodochrous]MCQ4135244.1 phosphotransferase family protein [Rhodococcus rhodochrous]MDJ0020553.1 phosphotransferase family protein [Rhodococcus rhodochrous]